MIINVGSLNPSKIDAVKETISHYDFLRNARVVPKEVDSGVRAQPMSLVEISLGAKNRAKEAFRASKCDLGIGIESGLIKIPKNKVYIDLCVCSIYDRRRFAYGVSQGFQVPPRVADFVLREKDLTQASNAAKVTNNPKIGEAEGLIGILTKGRVSRTAYTVQAIVMALVSLENRELYYERR